MIARGPSAWATPCPDAPARSGKGKHTVAVDPGPQWARASRGRGVGAHLAFLIADPPVELLPLQAQEVLPRMDYATLGCDGPGGVDIIPSHHADRNACTLAFADSFRDLEETREVGGSIKARGICVQALPFPSSESAAQCCPHPYPSTHGLSPLLPWSAYINS